MRGCHVCLCFFLAAVSCIPICLVLFYVLSLIALLIVSLCLFSASEGAARMVRAVHMVHQGMCVWAHP